MKPLPCVRNSPAGRNGREACAPASYGFEPQTLERDEVRFGPFCFSGGEAIHVEGCEGRCGASAERPDKVDVRRPETQRAG